MTEILAPAGDYESAAAAINAGADAVYLGLTSFSARSSARNFSLEELEKICSYARLFGVKIYVAMNTLVKEDEREEFIKTAISAWNAGADAIIMQDMYLGKYLKQTYPQLILHLSTQAGVCNEYGARLASECGFSRVILARETKIEDIKKITSVIETEAFVQGALCTCFSGQCYMSSFAGGNSGNRGKCKQPCRKRYTVDREGFDDYAYRISLSDLSLGGDVKKLIEAGVTSFKIEGRMRRSEYVSAAVAYYKKIIDGSVCDEDLSALKRTYNRGNYTKGLALGQDKSFISSVVQGHIGEFVGAVTVVSGKYFCPCRQKRSAGDGFKILRGGSEIGGATFAGDAKGGFYLNSKTRLKNGDKVFITTDAELNERLADKKRRLPVRISFYCKAGEKLKVELNGETFYSDFTVERASNMPLTENDVKKCFNKIDTYPFDVEYANTEICGEAFSSLSQLNGFRRSAYAGLYARLTSLKREKIVRIDGLPAYENPTDKNGKTAVIAGELNGIQADIGILKPDDYCVPLDRLYSSFAGEKFLYLPPFLSGEEIEKLKPVISRFDGIYCDGYYSVLLAADLSKKLFAGTGFNISNSISLAGVRADYFAISKELTVREIIPLRRADAFYLIAGGIKIMDLIYCPFGRSCRQCDKRRIYTLTDGDGRAFPLRRYSVGECRFEVYNCSPLVGGNADCGALADLTCVKNPVEVSRRIDDSEGLKKLFDNNYTKGHTQNPVL